MNKGYRKTESYRSYHLFLLYSPFSLYFYFSNIPTKDKIGKTGNFGNLGNPSIAVEDKFRHGREKMLDVSRGGTVKDST